jgi:glycosyltransferase involved in cell wall biosynthesis
MNDSTNLESEHSRDASNFLVSCIIPVHNGQNYLSEAIDSAIAQSYRNLEIIVVDDGSTDTTRDLLRRYRTNNNISVIELRHSGPARARNRGIVAASGRFIAFLDADDIWQPEKVEVQMAFLLQGSPLRGCFTQVRNFWMPDALSEQENLKDSGYERIAHPYFLSSFICERALFDEFGYFDSEIEIGEDSDFFSRLKKANVPIGVLPDNLVQRRIHNANLTRNLSYFSLANMFEVIEKQVFPARKVRDEKLNTSDLLQLVQGFLETFDASQAFFYQIVDRNICINYTTRELFELLSPSLAHLRLNSLPNSVDFTIDAAHFEGHDSFFEEIVSIAENVIITTDHEISFGRDRRSLTILDHSSRRAFYLFQGLNCINDTELSATFHRVFKSLRGIEDWQLLHSAVVCRNSTGIMIVGRGGAGKSTLAISCLLSGFSYLSDDYCFISCAEHVAACSLYSSGKLFTKDIYDRSVFYPLRGEGRHDDRSKKTLFQFRLIFPTQVINQCSIRAIFIPVVSDDREASIVKVSPIIALRELAPSTIFQMPRVDASDLQKIGQVVERLPCFVIRMGADIEDSVHVLEQWLDDTVLALDQCK